MTNISIARLKQVIVVILIRNKWKEGVAMCAELINKKLLFETKWSTEPSSEPRIKSCEKNKA